jgi:hypothetical protein
MADSSFSGLSNRLMTFHALHRLSSTGDRLISSATLQCKALCAEVSTNLPVQVDRKECEGLSHYSLIMACLALWCALGCIVGRAIVCIGKVRNVLHPSTYC